jgi:CRP-like cAMP-binding protein
VAISASALAFSDDEHDALRRVNRHPRPVIALPDPISDVSDRGFLANLPADLVAELTRSASLVHYRRGSLITPTHRGPWATIVVGGLLRQYISARGGRQVTVRYVRAGDLVGSGDTADGSLGLEVEAVEPSAVLHLDVAQIERSPEFSLALSGELTSRLDHVYRALAGVAFGTVRSRVARDLLERAGTASALLPGAWVRVTQQALADATGSAREVVSRALRELRLLGIVETDRSRVTILRVDALIREAGIGL